MVWWHRRPRLCHPDAQAGTPVPPLSSGRSGPRTGQHPVMPRANQRVLPGYRLSLSFTLLYLGVLVIIPLGAVLVTAGSLSWEQFRAAVWTDRARAAYALTFGAALAAAV